MIMVERLPCVGLVVCALMVVSPPPGSSAVQEPSAVSTATVLSAAGASVTSAVRVRSTSIIGAAWQADNTPIPHARVRLRNTLTGRMATHAVANESGQFSFHNVETGSYLVELVSENGKLLAVGHAFTIGPGETVATFVRLGTRVPWFTGFFSNAAAAVASSAAAAGVTALSPETMRAVSPTQ
jgi:hypothetical protein